MKEFYLQSKGRGKIHCCQWEQEGQLRGVVQIVHGVAEYAQRYEEFARFLNAQGYLVVAEDHMGHGKSWGGDLPRGYFYGGWSAAVADCHHLTKHTMAAYPGVPYILFGHSMGSFLVRTYLYTYPNSGIRAAVLCGTGWQPEAVLAGGLALCTVECRGGREQQPNQKLNDLMFGSYTKGIADVRTEFDWLNRDPAAVDAYMADPLCGFPVTAGLARDMLTGLRMNQKTSNLAKMKQDLPVLFIAGQADPVGAMGKGVVESAGKFMQAGMRDVSVKLYKNARHEILNELNKSEVYQDIYRWIREKT